jgi:CRISPR-associated endonuclease/helicase Cas3
MAKFWAHSDPNGLGFEDPGSKAQLLAEHLHNTARIAVGLANSAAPLNPALTKMAQMAGLLHDYGKYTSCFQNMILTGRGKCQHSIHGALAARLFGLSPGVTERGWAMPIVHAIAAHHAGLRDHSSLEPETRHNHGGELVKQLKEAARGVWRVALEDQPLIRRALVAAPPPPHLGSKDLFTRMLLSCLVDADRLDSAGRQPDRAPLNASERLSRLVAHIEGLEARARQGGGNATVLNVRQQAQELCRDAGQSDARLLSLAVPTGGGKTLATMRFALERAAKAPGDYRRIIVVIPFLSIIEQNAEVYCRIFGDEAIFEHHSGAVHTLRRQPSGGDEPDHFQPESESDRDAALPVKRPETENWDAPVIVTTSVRFFESLFSNHPSDLRRVHNIARSIIVLDEVQTLPRRLLAPLLDMLRELTEDWGCTVVMATATQPAFEARSPQQASYAWPAGTVTPIIPPVAAAQMHAAVRRVRIEWRIEEPLPWPALAAEMLNYPQALCVVNVREHAARVYDELLAQTDLTARRGILHLSTRMCAQHRLDVLAVARALLKDGLPCRVVSTQLIEAGVDVDFPIAFRALGPLDAIVQVAGRVDREGKLTDAAGVPAGRLIVFATEDGKTPPYEYKEATAVTEALARERDLQTDDLPAMQSYFERYYGGADDETRGKPLTDLRKDNVLAFAKLADEFEMINSRTKDVFVPYGEGKRLIEELANSKHGEEWKLLRQLQRYTVGLHPWNFENARRDLYEVVKGSDIWACGDYAYDSDGRGLLAKASIIGPV